MKNIAKWILLLPACLVVYIIIRMVLHGTMMLSIGTVVDHDSISVKVYDILTDSLFSVAITMYFSSEFAPSPSKGVLVTAFAFVALGVFDLSYALLYGENIYPTFWETILSMTLMIGTPIYICVKLVNFNEALSNNNE